ncbi:glycosyl hydrolase [Bacillus spongiae]|uniref:glucan endo-1,3-beta-D-glucosidase n=1 Tax=Bacillus spongiae TaxID=2683610 RepID=A0ABU8HEC3_9BACI
MKKVAGIVMAFILTVSLMVPPTANAFPGEVSLGAGSYSTVKPNGVNDLPSTIYKTGNVTGATPTNDWWSSTAWVQYSEQQYPHPLALNNQAEGLRIYNPSHHIKTEGAITQGSMNAIDDFILGHSGTSNFNDTKVDQFSDWFVTNEYKAGANTLSVTYGHGSPYVYATYEGGNPQITLPSLPPTIWYGDANSNVLGITTEKGSHYALFGPEGSTWTGIGTKKLTNNLNGKNYFSVAVLPDNSVATLEKFKQYAYSHVVDTKVDWAYDEATSQVKTTYSFETVSKEGSTKGTLFALYPHQWKNTDKGLLNYTYPSVRGVMKVAEGTSFTTNMVFNGVLPSLPDLGTYDKNVLAGYIDEAQHGNLNPIEPDTYWVGKHLGVLSTLAPIAEQVGDQSAANEFRQEMKDRLEDWFTASHQNGSLKNQSLFYYNQNWGTLLGYPDNFGSVLHMNDHHFHYGYYIKAAAELARVDKEWASQGQWGQMVEMLIKDIANWDRNDDRFPFLRNFDMYAGHSWASGDAVFNGEYIDGNNNESSSEGMNAWAGIILWGEATGNKELRDLGIYLYTTEMNAINEYWFDVNNENFPEEYVGETASMVWGGATIGNRVWWTEGEEEIHGINWLPFTAASLYLAQYPEYTKRNYDALFAKNNGDNWDNWEDLIWMYRAIENPGDAIRQFNERKDVFVPEAGNTKANAYHWIHNLNALGSVDRSVTADYPFYAVFKKNNVKTYVVYNMSNEKKTVTFSDGKVVTAEPNQFNTGNGDTIDPVTNRNAFEKIEAEDFDLNSGVETEGTTDVGGGENIGWTSNGDYIAFNNVDFGDGATGVQGRIASESSGTIELRLGSVNGSLIGEIDLNYTGGWQQWETSSSTILPTSGIHDLYLVFKGDPSADIGNLNWITFTKENSGANNDVIEEADYRIEVANAGADQLTFTFIPKYGTSEFVHFHYVKNGGNQQNVIATKVGDAWEYTIQGVNKGDSLNYYFTYKKDPLAYDTPKYDYTY